MIFQISQLITYYLERKMNHHIWTRATSFYKYKNALQSQVDLLIYS